jgi:hypothetical protein
LFFVLLFPGAAGGCSVVVQPLVLQSPVVQASIRQSLLLVHDQGFLQLNWYWLHGQLNVQRLC